MIILKKIEMVFIILVFIICGCDWIVVYIMCFFLGIEIF